MSSEGVAERRVGGRCGALRLVRGWRVRGRIVALLGGGASAGAREFLEQKARLAESGANENKPSSTTHSRFPPFCKRTTTHTHSSKTTAMEFGEAMFNGGGFLPGCVIFFFEAAAAPLPSCAPARRFIQALVLDRAHVNSRTSDPGPGPVRGAGAATAAERAAQRSVSCKSRTEPFSHLSSLLSSSPPARPPPPRPAPRR